MECGDLSPLSFWPPDHSDDLSPHSKSLDDKPMRERFHASPVPSE